MASRLRPLETTGLYLLILVSGLFFFIAGILVGRWVPQETVPPEAIAQHEAIADDSDEDLGFFRELVGTQDSGSNEKEEDGQDRKIPASRLDSVADAEPPTNGRLPVSEIPVRGTAEPPERSFFTVQVGALENRRTVNQIVMRLTAKGYPSRVVEPGEQANQAYLIWVEDCETRLEAEELEARLKGDGFQTYIKQVQEPVRR